MGQLFLIAVRNLAQHRKRTFLLGGAIAGVTALLVVLLALSTGVKSTMLESATTLMTGHVNVAGFYKVTSGQSAPLVTQAARLEALTRKTLGDDLSYLSTRQRGWGRLISVSASVQVGMGGIDIAKEPGFRKVIQLVSGNLDELAKPNTLLIFEEQAKKLEVKIGDALTISSPTPRGVNNTVDVTVVAVARNVGLFSQFNVFVSEGTLRALYQLKPDSTGALHLYLHDLEKIPDARAKLRKTFEGEGFLVMDPNPQPFWMKFETVNREDWTGQKLDLTTWEDEIAFVKWVVTALDGLTGILTFVLLTIIAIGIMNTMWIAIRERTREIGTLRAIGMQRGRVLQMFLIEGFSLSLLGTLSGAVVGLIICAVLNAMSVPLPAGVQLFLMSNTLNLAVDARGIINAVLLITLCTTAISLIPSFLAARLKPITAMHHIG